MRDFTLNTYRQLLETLKQKNYDFKTFEYYISKYSERPYSDNPLLVILRHDVDLLPEYALRLANIENELGICGTYYFRIIPESFNVKIIHEIAELGNEIGYHYEDVDLVLQRQKRLEGIASQIIKKQNKKNTPQQAQKDSTAGKQSNNGNTAIKQFDNDASMAALSSLSVTIELAYELFKVNLAKMRETANIKTICMHGSPRAKYDNKLIWQKYSYKDLGIIGEPYLDIDWNEFGYLTDTGRRWNGNKVSVRDHVSSKFNFNFRSTQDIIDNAAELPEKLMITIHPQRWTDAPLPWMKELIMQNMKNVAKRVLIKIKD